MAKPRRKKTGKKRRYHPASAQGRVTEALEEAQRQGKARYVGDNKWEATDEGFQEEVARLTDNNGRPLRISEIKQKRDEAAAELETKREEVWNKVEYLRSGNLPYVETIVNWLRKKGLDEKANEIETVWETNRKNYPKINQELDNLPADRRQHYRDRMADLLIASKGIAAVGKEDSANDEKFMATINRLHEIEKEMANLDKEIMTELGLNESIVISGTELRTLATYARQNGLEQQLPMVVLWRLKIHVAHAILYGKWLDSKHEHIRLMILTKCFDEERVIELDASFNQVMEVIDMDIDPAILLQQRA